MIRDLTDDQARAALPLKWGVDPGVVPAWVAEMDYALAEPVERALLDAVRRGATGYPAADGGGLGEAFAGFAARHWGWAPDPDHVVATGGVISGVRLALEMLCPPGPVVVPLPAYPPFRDVVAVTGRELVTVDLDPDAERATIDLDAVERAFAAGARVFLLCNPHNPLGRAWSREELEALAAITRRHDVRVVADEVHGPLTLPGATFTPYLTVDDGAVVVTGASKSFNMPALHCAHLVLPDALDRKRVREVPVPAGHDWSGLGVAAAVAAWRDGDEWNAALRARLGEQRSLLTELLPALLPQARVRPLEATYLAWLDLRAYGVADPAAEALRHGVRLAPGDDYQPGLPGHVRLNLATSADRLRTIVERLATALSRSSSSGRR